MDWIGFAFSIVGSILLALKKKVAFLIFLGSNVLWILFSLYNGIYSMVCLNLFYIVVNGYGWYNWSKGEKENGSF